MFKLFWILGCVHFLRFIKSNRKPLGPDTKTLEDLGVEDGEKLSMIVRLMNVTATNFLSGRDRFIVFHFEYITPERMQGECNVLFFC